MIDFNRNFEKSLICLVSPSQGHLYIVCLPSFVVADQILHQEIFIIAVKLHL